MSTPSVLPPREAYRLWAADWDNHPSAIVALEARYLTPWLGDLRDKFVLDISCGTGRWLEHAASLGARVAGFDLSAEMLAQAVGKAGVRTRLAVADAARLPVRDACADTVLCTLSLGHVRDAAAVIAGMARTLRAGGLAIATDFHPEAFRRGWKRTFRSGGRLYEVENHYHPADEILEAARRHGLVLEEFHEPCFGPEERPIFVNAGKPALFDEVQGIPAVFLARWRKQT